MGVPHSTARTVAPLSFLYDFAAQQYGMLAKPNMKDIHDANISFFSPQPFYIAGFFFPQQILQLLWLWRLWKGEDRGEDLDQMIDYTPIYAVGNICIGTWMFFWNANDLRTSNVFVTINTLAQLSYVCLRLGNVRHKGPDRSPSPLTHAIAKTFAGIGVLDLLHNTSAAYFKDRGPATTVKVLTGLGFGLGCAVSDWMLGACLVYDLIALGAGQKGTWRMLLNGYAIGCAGIVGSKFWLSSRGDRHGRSDDLDYNKSPPQA
ncbi:hypothetical protein BDY21DRAFT_330756 [Lineolata rhizophorae]|uniref:Uncharacterized protein n=1 Tax=Lineolata rhizophorae TaxID=578093 RepID=A0A6A6PEM1_9PEZI|nr:hypothetical protein BDY21DRAFT_330756 [Lineolata rhizophorae]